MFIDGRIQVGNENYYRSKLCPNWVQEYKTNSVLTFNFLKFRGLFIKQQRHKKEIVSIMSKEKCIDEKCIQAIDILYS